jgi:hypothetical protein
MSTPRSQIPSFSPGQRWRIGIQVTLLTLVVVLVVGMANYLSRDYFTRIHLSTLTRAELSPRTINFLKSVTNRVKVTLYYDKDEPLYSTVVDLLNKYHLANPNITVRRVDYLRDTGAAQKVKADYKLIAGGEKNLVIFDCEGRTKIVDGATLTDNTLERVVGGKPGEVRSRPVAFKGELMFTSVLLAVTNPKPLIAYFLTGNGEHQLDSGDEVNGYLSFAGLLKQNYIKPETLSLLGTNTVPMDCNLLVIAGPTSVIPDPVLDKIDQYLTQGGRLLAMFKFESVNKQVGLERVLAKWGVHVGANVVKDPDNTVAGTDVILKQFARHPIVSPLQNQSSLHLILPRTIGKFKASAQAADAPRVEELAISGVNSFLLGDTVRKQAFPVAVAVEKGAIKGVITERGTTRMVIVGDSIFLANRQIDSAANRDFAGFALNWLLDRTQLLEGLGPRPITEFRLAMTHTQLRAAQWLLLGGMPGSTLLVGWLVWLRRRR